MIFIVTLLSGLSSYADSIQATCSLTSFAYGEERCDDAEEKCIPSPVSKTISLDLVGDEASDFSEYAGPVLELPDIKISLVRSYLRFSKGLYLTAKTSNGLSLRTEGVLKISSHNSQEYEISCQISD